MKRLTKKQQQEFKINIVEEAVIAKFVKSALDLHEISVKNKNSLFSKILINCGDNLTDKEQISIEQIIRVAVATIELAKEIEEINNGKANNK